MLTYIIDAFNLINKIPYLSNSLTPRSALIDFLRKKHLTGSVRNKVIVVFDGYETDDRILDKSFQILFSDNKTADDVIKDYVARQKYKKQIFVVSDDREIRFYTKEEGAKSLRISEFLHSGKKKDQQNSNHEEKEVTCSEMIEITEELEKLWVDENES